MLFRSKENGFKITIHFKYKEDFLWIAPYFRDEFQNKLIRLSKYKSKGKEIKSKNDLTLSFEGYNLPADVDAEDEDENVLKMFVNKFRKENIVVDTDHDMFKITLIDL